MIFATNIWIHLWIFALYCGIKFKIVSCVILDSRCYLEGGGSAESFLASEDTVIGAVIGKLRINGNPNLKSGDINLSLREKNAPIRIVPGTKELALISPLDKEGVIGPSSIYVNVICDRRHSNDPSFVIPVNVRVTDVNDNAPQWIGAPYTLTLSEVTVPGTRILQGIRAVDNDQQGPFSTVEYQVLPGQYSEYVQFLNPLEGILVLKKPLDYETMKNFTVKLRAQDQGTPSKFTDTLLKVIVTDADDQNPKFQREFYKGELPADGNSGEIKIFPESLKAADQDEGICAPIQYSLIQSPETKYFKIDPLSGQIDLVLPLNKLDLLNGITLVVKATQTDNSDRYALATVTLTRPNTHSEINALSFVQKMFSVKIREDTPVGSLVLALPVNTPGKQLRYTIPDPIQSQFFSIGSFGEVVLQKSLDYEKFTKHQFEVIATDGISNSTAEVILDVIDVNEWEPRFRESEYEFSVPINVIRSSIENLDGVMIGKIEAADGDRNDNFVVGLKGPYAHMFEVDKMGNLWMHTDRPINVSVIHLTGTVTDSGSPPKSTSVPITIKIDGIITAGSFFTSNMIGIFGFSVIIFATVILALSFYIMKNKNSSKTRNRVHSTHNTITSKNLVMRKKNILDNDIHGLPRDNVTMTNPINDHGGSDSSLSAGASTVLAVSLEREERRERERERKMENYPTASNLMSCSSVANGSDLFKSGVGGDGIDRDSISNKDSPIPIEDCKRTIDWQRSELSSSTEIIGSTENNLTVYF